MGCQTKVRVPKTCSWIDQPQNINRVPSSSGESVCRVSSSHSSPIQNQFGLVQSHSSVIPTFLNTQVVLRTKAQACIPAASALSHASPGRSASTKLQPCCFQVHSASTCLCLCMSDFCGAFICNGEKAHLMPMQNSI